MSVIHTTCKHCGQDIEGINNTDWRDRGNNRKCNDGTNYHEPAHLQTIEDEVKRIGLRITSEYADHNPSMDDSANMDHYRVTLRRKDGDQRRTLTIHFSKGYGHKGAEPTAAEVIDCLLSDASGADQDFEDWASDLGFDTDSRKAERIYTACVRIAAKLRRFLGDDYEAFQNAERL